MQITKLTLITFIWRFLSLLITVSFFCFEESVVSFCFKPSMRHKSTVYNNNTKACLMSTNHLVMALYLKCTQGKNIAAMKKINLFHIRILLKAEMTLKKNCFIILIPYCENVFFFPFFIVMSFFSWLW